MPGLRITSIERPRTGILYAGGIFLDDTLPSSIIESVSSKTFDSDDPYFSILNYRKPLFKFPAVGGGGFLCMSLSIRKKNEAIENSSECLGFNGDNRSLKEAAAGTTLETAVNEAEKKKKVKLGRRRGRGAVNTTKHLWAGAVAAMVSRSVLISTLL